MPCGPHTAEGWPGSDDRYDSPRIAPQCATGLVDDGALRAIALVDLDDFYQQKAKKGEHLGKMIDRVKVKVIKRYCAKQRYRSRPLYGPD